MSFLAKHNFDFNKLFSDGISYCTLLEANEYKEKLLLRQKARADLIESDSLNESSESPNLCNHIPIPEEHKEFLNKLNKEIEVFLSTNEHKEKIVSNLNGFQRKLVYQMIEKFFYNRVSTSSRTENNQSQIVIERKRTLEEEKLLDEKRVRTEDSDLMETIGITTILQLISESVIFLP